MASFITIAGIQFELISLVVGLVVGYIIGHFIGKYRSMYGGGLGSDVELKKNVSSTDTKEFLNSINAYSYEYKNPNTQGTAPGQRYGVLAQEVEQTEMGKSIVLNTKKGKFIDTNQGFGLVLASLSDINKRLDKLENKHKAK